MRRLRRNKNLLIAKGLRPLKSPRRPLGPVEPEASSRARVLSSQELEEEARIGL
jgi:hypothetical protein